MIQIGYFSDFKGAPTMVLAGGAADFNRLADTLLVVGSGAVDVIARLREAGQQVHLANLSSLKITSHAAHTNLLINGGVAHWAITDSYTTRLNSLIVGLKEQASPGHQYLDSGSPGLQVILSKDEYSKPLG